MTKAQILQEIETYGLEASFLGNRIKRYPLPKRRLEVLLSLLKAGHKVWTHNDDAMTVYIDGVYFGPTHHLGE